MATGQFDQSLFTDAQRAQEVRELGDCSAKPPTAERASAIVELGERFVAAVEQLLASPGDRARPASAGP